VAGDICGVALEIDARLGFDHAHGGKRHRHQRRLRILGERQRLGRTVPHDGGELVAERGVDLVEHAARRREILGERLAHAHGLASLAGKYQRDRHFLPRKGRAYPRAVRHRARRRVKDACLSLRVHCYLIRLAGPLPARR